MKNITGPPVTGADFFGREEELARLRRAVEAGNHALLSAPRRVGKSSLVLRLCDMLLAEGWQVVRLDVQHCSDEAEFVRALLRATVDGGLEVPGGVKAVDGLRRFRSLFAGTKGQVGPVGLEVGGDEADVWRKLAASVQRVLSSAGGQGPVLIAVDELPIFLGKVADSEDGVRRARGVLDWLRGVRQNTGGRVSWIITGSVGLDSFVERRGLHGAINDLTPQTLGAFSDETAVAFLKALGANLDRPRNMGDEVCAEIIRRVGWPLPFYLQLLFSSLMDRPAERREAPGFPTTEDVAAAYDDLLQPHQQIRFDHWDSRLDQQFDDPADAGIARYVLAHVCQRARGCPRGKLFNLLLSRQPNVDPDALERRLVSILHLLGRDGYLLQTGSTHAFRSFLLRDYWKRRFCE
ncbi:MAG: ATP-binding protein [Armatimonadetes bacterium]|nr:ATP-binding protein [Armatimonadota bacterium]